MIYVVPGHIDQKLLIGWVIDEYGPIIGTGIGHFTRPPFIGPLRRATHTCISILNHNIQMINIRGGLPDDRIYIAIG